MVGWLGGKGSKLIQWQRKHKCRAAYTVARSTFQAALAKLIISSRHNDERCHTHYARICVTHNVPLHASPATYVEMFLYDQSAGRQMFACVYTVLFFLLVNVCSVRTCCHIIADCLNYLVKICVTMECILCFALTARHHFGTTACRAIKASYFSVCIFTALLISV